MNDILDLCKYDIDNDDNDDDNDEGDEDDDDNDDNDDNDEAMTMTMTTMMIMMMMMMMMMITIGTCFQQPSFNCRKLNKENQKSAMHKLLISLKTLSTFSTASTTEGSVRCIPNILRTCCVPHRDNQSSLCT